MSDDGFVTEAPSSVQRRRQQRRALVTVLVFLLLLFFAFWYAWSYYKAARDSTATPQVCITATPTPGAATTVNVYNATGRNGLAAATAASMKQRGFTVGKVSNDPLKKAIKGSAEVRSGTAGAAQAKQVAANVAGSTVVVDKRTDGSVDLVLGNAFTALSAKAVAPATPTPAVTCR